MLRRLGRKQGLTRRSSSPSTSRPPGTRRFSSWRSAPSGSASTALCRSSIRSSTARRRSIRTPTGATTSTARCSSARPSFATRGAPSCGSLTAPCSSSTATMHSTRGWSAVDSRVLSSTRSSTRRPWPGSCWSFRRDRRLDSRDWSRSSPSMSLRRTPPSTMRGRRRWCSAPSSSARARISDGRRWARFWRRCRGRSSTGPRLVEERQLQVGLRVLEARKAHPNQTHRA